MHNRMNKFSILTVHSMLAIRIRGYAEISPRKSNQWCSYISENFIENLHNNFLKFASLLGNLTRCSRLMFQG